MIMIMIMIMNTSNRKRETEGNGKVEIARSRRFMHRVFVAGASLMSLHPNEQGWVASFPYNGQPFNTNKYRLELGSWDHTHCFLCNKRIKTGDRWWAALPPDEIDLCESCYEAMRKAEGREQGGTREQG